MERGLKASFIEGPSLGVEGVGAEIIKIGRIGGGFGGEAVAAAAEGLDDGIGRGDGSIELAAQVGDVGLDDVGVMFPIEVVEMLEEFLLANDNARAVHEVLEDVVLGGREVDEDAGTMNGLFQRIEGDAEGVESGVGRALAAADEGFGAGDEFAEVEGLGEVVVCAGVEELDDGAGAFAGGEDEDGGRVLAGADALKEAEAVETGKHEVEDDEVVAEVAGAVVACETVGGPVDSEAGAVAEGGGEIFGEADFIFDEQDAHGESNSSRQYDAGRIKRA
jgi:hypothetical protein